jgi:riboflavin kinase/FMN adenylyltransferase
MSVVRSGENPPAGPRTVAVGRFDGVHAGHRRLLADAEPPVGVFTWEPRQAEELLCSVDRRVELLAEAGAATVAVLPAGAPLPETGGASVVGDPDDANPATQAAIRRALSVGDVAEAARLLGRPPEVEGVVVGGDERGRTLGFPTANLAVESGLVVPALGIYAGWAAGTRAAISIGTNPTYGGAERRIEAFLLDFEGDLYGRRLVVELWRRLRDEVAFASEQELVEQIGADVAATRRAARPT